MKACGLEGRQAWAFGLGLERLAMRLFAIPDIRLFWSRDPRFLQQFASGAPVQYQPFAKLPPICQDLSFGLKTLDMKTWKQQVENDFVQAIRDDMVESVKLWSSYENVEKKAISLVYRITYSPRDSTMSNPGEFAALVHREYQQMRRSIQEQFQHYLTLR